jgi:Sulfotransferase domain
MNTAPETKGSKGRKAKADDVTFLMVGCQRCGSTWVDKALRGHPEIHLPPQKQTYFFDSNYDDGMEWYLEQFGQVPPGAKAIGEIATSYALTDILPLVAKELPHIKIIMSVRNPVDRAISFYKSRKDRFGWTSMEEALADNPGLTPPDEYNAKRASQFSKLKGNRIGWATLEEALNDDPKIVERGQYIDQIETILEHFPKERFLLLFYDDLVSDDRAYLKSILSFLEVDDTFESPVLGQRVQVSAFGRTRKVIRKLNLGILVDTISQSFLGDRLRRRLAKRGGKKDTRYDEYRLVLEKHYDFELNQLRKYSESGND